jgi:hypothetical protein
MKTFELQEAIHLLEHTPGVLTSLLGALPDSWHHANEGGESWSPYDILGHLIHAETTDWLTRTRTILEHGESKPFHPFDRFAQFEHSKGKSTAMLLSDFQTRRMESVRQLKLLNLTDADLEKTGTHPEFGRVTLKQLLSTWVVHDLGHIRQIARVMAKQYREEIGPWEVYLPVVKE